MAVNYRTLHQARLDNSLEWRELKQKSIFQKLFASEIHEVLLKLERMRGVWQPMRLGTLEKLSKLLRYVPQELLRALDRTSNFWNDIASLCGSQDYSFEDVEKMSGLWPKNSKRDRDNFQTSMTNNTLFPNITDTVVRNKIQEKVATMDCRVPTLLIIQAEASALRSIVSRLNSALESRGAVLHQSAIIFAKKEISDLQYFICFLAAARACHHESEPVLEQEVKATLHGDTSTLEAVTMDSILEPTELRLVSAPPYGVWKLDYISEGFYLKNLRSWDASLKEDELELLLLLKDFFESFFGGIKMDVSPKFYSPSVKTTEQQSRARHVSDSANLSCLPLNDSRPSSGSLDAIQNSTSSVPTVNCWLESEVATLYDEKDSVYSQDSEIQISTAEAVVRSGERPRFPSFKSSTSPDSAPSLFDRSRRETDMWGFPTQKPRCFEDTNGFDDVESTNDANRYFMSSSPSSRLQDSIQRVHQSKRPEPIVISENSNVSQFAPVESCIDRVPSEHPTRLSSDSHPPAALEISLAEEIRSILDLRLDVCPDHNCLHLGRSES